MANIRTKRDAVSKLTTPGHIYFIQGQEGGLVKIGWATCPRTRMAQMQAHGPLKLILLHSEPGNGKEEAALHKQFASARQHGEWFEPLPALMAEIEARRGRNFLKVYEPGAPDPVWADTHPRRTRPRKPGTEQSELPPAPYWDYGNPGWEKLVRAVQAPD